MKFSLARNSEAISNILLLAELVIHKIFLQFSFLEYTRTVYIWPCHFLQALKEFKLK